MTGNNIRRSWGEYVLLATAVVSEVVQTWLTEMNFPGGRVAIIPARKEFGSGFWRSHACRRGHGPGRRPCTAGPTGTAGTAASACAGLSSRGATRCAAPRLLPRPSPPPSPPPLLSNGARGGSHARGGGTRKPRPSLTSGTRRGNTSTESEAARGSFGTPTRSTGSRVPTWRGGNTAAGNWFWAMGACTKVTSWRTRSRGQGCGPGPTAGGTKGNSWRGRCTGSANTRFRVGRSTRVNSLTTCERARALWGSPRADSMRGGSPGTSSTGRAA